jgi:hypothetical protein
MQTSKFKETAYHFFLNNSSDNDSDEIDYSKDYSGTQFSTAAIFENLIDTPDTQNTKTK